MMKLENVNPRAVFDAAQVVVARLIIIGVCFSIMAFCMGFVAGRYM